MEKIDANLKQLMSTVFEVPLEEVTESSSTDNIESWDSLRHLNLILALEEEFHVVIPDEEVGNLVNFNLIKIIINDLRK